MDQLAPRESGRAVWKSALQK